MKRMQNLTRYQPLAGRTGRRPFRPWVLPLFVLLAAGTGFAGWQWLQSRQAADKASSESDTAVDNQSKSGAMAIKSGNGSFSIVFPDGWNGIVRDKAADLFVIPGERQPESKPGQRAIISDVTGYNADGPAVFSAMVREDFTVPTGEATDFMAGSGDALLSGKKYVHVFLRDETERTGVQRSRGDITYTYAFALGGTRELRVVYDVYAADPRNNVSQVDEVVRSIRLHK